MCTWFMSIILYMVGDKLLWHDIVDVSTAQVCLGAVVLHSTLSMYHSVTLYKLAVYILLLLHTLVS